ncbi:MAG: SDR family NAD(P)-dependent oxidoreductase [Spirochaetes bacterium]|nr:SDR family NAD(P)-dependent oxidoreductase [Spirochaetota bacterium]
MENVNGKVAFITGGASGMGLGMAKVFADNGMKIVIADIRQNALDEAMKYFKGTGQPVHPVKLDVTDREAYKQAADEAEKVFGKIHVLVNNAGVGAPGKIGSAPFATYNDFDFGLGVNIGGVVNGILTILPRIISHGEGGHVVSTASTSGLSVVEWNAIYCMSKAAVSALMETLAAELTGTNIGASVYFPGPVATDIARSSTETRPDHLKNQKEEDMKAPPDHDDSAFMDPLEVGEYVLRGIRRNDLFILSHPEFKNAIKSRFEALMRAIPDEPVNIKRYDAIKNIGHLVYNPVYDLQTSPGKPDWRKK